MQKLRSSWLTKGAAAALLALALMMGGAHMATAQAATAHAPMHSAVEAQSFSLSSSSAPVAFAQNACFAPLAVHSMFATSFSPALEPTMIVHPSSAHCLSPMSTALTTNSPFAQAFLHMPMNVATLLTQK